MRHAPVLLATLALTGCMAPWPVVTVTEPIRTDTVWTSDTTWVLEDIIYVERGVQLTIEPGTTIRGEPGAALVVTRGASLLARGERQRPILFTSNRPEGERAPGDWGGVVLLGAATVNVSDARIEGVPEDDSRGSYGGSDDLGSCGTLEWARIEFAGFEAYQNNELNGLTLGGCGSGTLLRHVQVHRSLDDGIEFFGGTVDGRNLVVTGAGDDSIDWDQGWRGRLQFLIVQQHPGRGDNGIEADNTGDDFNNLPRSAPRIWNATFIGANEAGGGQRGAVLREGTAGILANTLFAGWPASAIDIRDDATVQQATESGELDVRDSLLHAIGPGGDTWFETEDGTDDEAADYDDDSSFDEQAWFEEPERSNRSYTEPLLTAAFDPEAPDFTPSEDEATVFQGGPVPSGEFWDPSATFIGAVPPRSGTEQAWWEDWTAFPPD